MSNVFLEKVAELLVKSAGETAKKSDPEKWKRIVSEVKASGKGGKPGQWSARKAQIATQKYKASGGGYKGKKSSDNSLSKWTKEDWGTKSGKNSIQGEGATGERYLPKDKREKLSPQQYAATSRAKREGMKQGKQFVPQPEKIKKKVWGD